MPGQQAHDFVGYTTGSAATPPTAGIHAFDFVGYFVGVATQEPAAGVYAFDFVGYAAGNTAAVPSTARPNHGGYKPKRKPKNDDDLLLLL